MDNLKFTTRHSAQSTRSVCCVKIGSRKSEIKNVIVPVVQRIEHGFPKGKTAFLHEFARVIRRVQIAVIKRVEQLLRSLRVIRNLHVFTHPGNTTGDTKNSMRRFTLTAFVEKEVATLASHLPP